MSSAAQKLSEPEAEYQESAVAPAAPGDACPRSATKRRGRAASPARAQVASRGSWNVLAKELVEFPRPVHRIFLEADAQANPRERSGGRHEPSAAKSYGEAWLERESLRLRELAAGSRPNAEHGQPIAPRSRARFESARTLEGERLGGAVAQERRLAAAPAQRSLTESAGESRRRRAERQAAVAKPRGGSAVLPNERTARQSDRQAVRFEQRGLRRFLPGAATLAVLVGLLMGADALATSDPASTQVLSGSVKTSTGYVYVAKPGDTLWSIASRVEPGSDPRPLIAKLEGEIHGGELVPGDRLVLP